jgi:hypothetical protein
VGLVFLESQSSSSQPKVPLKAFHKPLVPPVRLVAAKPAVKTKAHSGQMHLVPTPIKIGVARAGRVATTV